MRIPRQTDYKLIMLLTLAEAGGQSLPLRDIAETYQLPLPFLRSIASQLVKQGLVESKEGAGGGYRLAKAADRISLADILMGDQAILEAVPCQEHGQSCPREGSCIAEPTWSKLEQKVSHALGSITLAEVA